MHARRPFVQAFESQDPAACFFVERFQKIYRVEAQAKEEKLTADARLELRQAESLPLMKEILERSKELSNLPLLKPMKNGVTYFVNQWEKLIVPFTQDGRLAIDNGSAERQLRRVASGRKAWLFAGSRNGAARFADILSLVLTADAAGASAGSYLQSVIANVDSWPQSRIDELLPHQWQRGLPATHRPAGAPVILGSSETPPRPLRPYRDGTWLTRCSRRNSYRVPLRQRAARAQELGPRRTHR